MKLPETENILKNVIKMLHRRFVHAGKTLTDLQILGCELHQNAFWWLGSTRTHWGSYSTPQTPYKREGTREGKGKGWE